MVKGSYTRYLLKAALLFGVYFATARIGLSIDAVSGFATLVWPPTGIALAAILILGYRFWPAITLAAFLVNLITGAPVLVALGIAIGNTLEALLGAYLLRRFIEFQISLERVKDVLGLVVLAAFISTSLSATIGTSSLLLGGTIQSSAYGSTWLAWWAGDMLGDLVVAPLIFVWAARPHLGWRSKRFLEASALTALLIVVSALVFGGFLWNWTEPVAFVYIVFPVLIWIALRFGPRGSVTSVFVVSIIAVWATVADRGPFAGDKLSHSLLLLQSFLAVAAITFMTMAAVVSEQKNTQRRQRQLTQRAAVLSKQRSRLTALNKTRDEFVAIASHQLRTPATAVKQYLALLLEGYSDALTESQKTFLQKAYENNDRQLRIVDDILRVAQLDLDKMKLDLKPHDIGKILDKAVAALQAKFDARRQIAQVVKPKKTVRARVDGEQLLRAIENLVENASNYSIEDKKIIVRLHQPQENEIQISVEDEGVGIKAPDLQYLFRKFSRVDNPLSRSVSGSGLGLYFSKKVIELHGGTIKVYSVAGQGSVFMIILPYRTEAKNKKKRVSSKK